MEKKLNLVLPHIKKRESQPSLLKEAFKITIKNGSIVLFLTFIMFSVSSLTELADHFVLAPVLTHFMGNSLLLPKNGSFIDSDPTVYKPIFKDLRFILAFKFVEWSFLCLVLMFAVAASVYSTHEAYTAKQLGLKDMLCGLRGKIRRPLKTTIWIVLVGLASAALLSFTIGVIGIMTEGSLSANLSWGVIILAALYYVYVAALWMVSLVVSVLEENLSGLKAIYKANDLLKGKKLKGFGLMALMILITYAMDTTFAFLASVTATHKAELVGRTISMLMVWPDCLMKLFVFVVYTLFYHECKKSHLVKEVPNPYAPISAIAEV